MKKIFTLLAFVFCVFVSQAQEEWTHIQRTQKLVAYEIFGIGDRLDMKTAITDASGNIYQMYYYDTPGDNLPEERGLMKSDRNGNIHWQFPLRYEIKNFKLTADGNILMFLSSGFLTSLDSNGNLLWETYVQGGANTSHLETDPAGNIIVAISPSTGLNLSYHTLASLSPQGTLNWVKTYRRPADSEYRFMGPVTDMVTDMEGNILVSSNIDLIDSRLFFGLLYGYAQDGTPLGASGPELLDPFDLHIDNIYVKGAGLLGLDANTRFGRSPHRFMNTTYNYLSGTFSNEVTTPLPLYYVGNYFVKENTDGSLLGKIFAREQIGDPFTYFLFKRAPDGTFSYFTESPSGQFFTSGPDGNLLQLSGEILYRSNDAGLISEDMLSQSFGNIGYRLDANDQLIISPQSISGFRDTTYTELNFLNLSSLELTSISYDTRKPAVDALSELKILNGTAYASFHAGLPNQPETSYFGSFAAPGDIENFPETEDLTNLLFDQDDTGNRYTVGMKYTPNHETGNPESAIAISRYSPSGNRVWTIEYPTFAKYPMGNSGFIKVLGNGNILAEIPNGGLFIMSPDGELLSRQPLPSGPRAMNDDYYYVVTISSIEQYNTLTGEQISWGLPESGKNYLDIAADEEFLYLLEIESVLGTYNSVISKYTAEGPFEKVGEYRREMTDDVLIQLHYGNETLAAISLNISSQIPGLAAFDTSLNEIYSVPVSTSYLARLSFNNIREPLIDESGRIFLLMPGIFENLIVYQQYAPDGEFLGEDALRPFDLPYERVSGSVVTGLTSINLSGLVLTKYLYSNGILYIGGRGLDDEGEFNAFLSAINVGTYGINFSLGDISISDSPFAVNSAVQASAAYEGTPPGDLTWDWGDGTQSPPASITGDAILGSHVYTEAGVYEVKLTSGSQMSSYRYVVVYNPDGGFVTGGGWIISPEDAYRPDPALTGKASFGFVSRYKKGASIPSGNTEFQFHAASFNFKSEVYEWLVVAGKKAQFKGKGAINGTPGYGFILTAMDGDLYQEKQADRFRIKIWDISTGSTVYDNQPNDDDLADATTALGGGSVVIHDPKKTLASTANERASEGDFNSEFSVYPVPVSEIVNIRIPAEHAGRTLSVSLTDLTGRIILEQEFTTGQVPQTYNLPVSVNRGNMYLLRIVDEQSRTLFRKMILTE